MNKTKTFYFHEQRHRDACQVFLNTIKIGPGEQVWEARFRPHKKNRSAAQQALMWIWHGQWSDHFGDEVRDEHIRFKKEFLLPVLLRDDVIDGIHVLYRIADMRRIDTGIDAGLLALYHLITTNALNTEQFSEILSQYEREASMEGCAFTVLGPQYDEAMGR